MVMDLLEGRQLLSGATLVGNLKVPNAPPVIILPNHGESHAHVAHATYHSREAVSDRAYSRATASAMKSEHVAVPSINATVLNGNPHVLGRNGSPFRLIRAENILHMATQIHNAPRVSAHRTAAKVSQAGSNSTAQTATAPINLPIVYEYLWGKKPNTG